MPLKKLYHFPELVCHNWLITLLIHYGKADYLSNWHSTTLSLHYTDVSTTDFLVDNQKVWCFNVVRGPPWSCLSESCATFLTWLEVSPTLYLFWCITRHDVYTFPKKKLNFSEVAFLLGRSVQCRSVNFGSDFICTLLLVTIWQKPHSKIPHCVNNISVTIFIFCNTSTIYVSIILGNTPAILKGAFLFGKSVCQKIWGYIFFDGIFCLLLQGAFPLVHKTHGHWPWSRVTMKNLEIKVAFLLGKSVGLPCLTFFFRKMCCHLILGQIV